HRRALRPFPTRRSSDLGPAAGILGHQGNREGSWYGALPVPLYCSSCASGLLFIDDSLNTRYIDLVRTLLTDSHSGARVYVHFARVGRTVLVTLTSFMAGTDPACFGGNLSVADTHNHEQLKKTAAH